MKKFCLLTLAAAAAFVLFSCGSDEPAPAPESDARLMPVPGAAPTPPAGTLPPPPPGSGTGASGMIWDVPQTWTEEQPSSSVRRAQYSIPGDDGDAECVVFYFGPGRGGDPLSNAQRWAGQFSKPDGSPALETMKTEQRTFAGYQVLWVEVSGTYQNVMVSGDRFPDYRLLGAIVTGPDAYWFFKVTGPRTTVEANRNAFESMLSTLHVAI